MTSETSNTPANPNIFTPNDTINPIYAIVQITFPTNALLLLFLDFAIFTVSCICRITPYIHVTPSCYLISSSNLSEASASFITTKY